jgi:membrane protein YdbS with pleckstrin-like domain/ribosomal protein L40E
VKGENNMFCEKCGAKLEDDALFCTKCGTKIGEGEKEKAKEEKVEDKEILLTVKPKFKFAYLTLPSLIVWLIMIIFFAGIMEIAASEDGTSGVGLAVGGVLIVILLLIIAIKVAFQKTQYKKLTYNFYKTKVLFEDSFLNLSQKEVKYKYIREVTMRQSFIQRWFNIGNIVLYTNAETGIGNGIQIINVENVHDVYKQIKEIVNV